MSKWCEVMNFPKLNAKENCRKDFTIYGSTIVEFSPSKRHYPCHFHRLYFIPVPFEGIKGDKSPIECSAKIPSQWLFVSPKTHKIFQQFHRKFTVIYRSTLNG